SCDFQAAEVAAGVARGPGQIAGNMSESPPNPQQLVAAYAACRTIARSQAKNFYYAFLALPREKRDALSAVYAFMRHADDIADDGSEPVEQRRTRLRQWLEAAQASFAGKPTDDAI